MSVEYLPACRSIVWSIVQYRVVSPGLQKVQRLRWIGHAARHSDNSMVIQLHHHLSRMVLYRARGYAPRPYCRVKVFGPVGSTPIGARGDWLTASCRPPRVPYPLFPAVPASGGAVFRAFLLLEVRSSERRVLVFVFPLSLVYSV